MGRFMKFCFLLVAMLFYCLVVEEFFYLDSPIASNIQYSAYIQVIARFCHYLYAKMVINVLIIFMKFSMLTSLQPINMKRTHWRLKK